MVSDLPACTPAGSALSGAGFLVGLKDEARLLRRVFPDVPVAISGATTEGAVRGAERLILSGVRSLVSFGLAGGLDASCPVGTIVIPHRVHARGSVYVCAESLRASLGADVPGVWSGDLLHSDTVVMTAVEKADLAARSGCGAVDMESGILAQAAEKAGLPFAVLRVVCDPAERDLPDAARYALSPEGGVQWGGMLRSLLRHPLQISALTGLGAESARARSKMRVFLEQICGRD
ncbi:hypothetical protein LOC54_02565 [Acetobacter sp. AN02]|uniref:phosphorylase family protein n=1 Tax=Acetobacter sp. AN02 TaxID=2894186 RepID=UPI0024342CDD|nr:hypothetical protein [Acetobacter sp. AN02]MDG6094006.1 hypothetical protein [Acetobacter sp. AN02]